MTSPSRGATTRKRTAGQDGRSTPTSSGEESVSNLARNVRQEIKSNRDKKRSETTEMYNESARRISDVMTSGFDDISKKLIEEHKFRLEKLRGLLKKRAAIEARMITSTRNIESAIAWAEKALKYSVNRRLHQFQRLHNQTAAL